MADMTPIYTDPALHDLDKISAASPDGWFGVLDVQAYVRKNPQSALAKKLREIETEIIEGKCAP
jgi:hypothetical protein